MIVPTHDVGLHSTRYSIVYIQSLTFPSKEPGPKKNIRIYIYILYILRIHFLNSVRQKKSEPSKLSHATCFWLVSKKYFTVRLFCQDSYALDRVDFLETNESNPGVIYMRHMWASARPWQLLAANTEHYTSFA